MSEQCGWDFLEAGDYQGALKLLKKEYSRNPVTLGNVGLAYLCMGNAQEAKDVFDKCLDASRDAIGHAWAGLARWMLELPAEAVRIWSEGLDCDDRDDASETELLLLLFYASVRQPGVFPRKQSKALLKKALGRPAADDWPGPLGRFVLKEIDEKQVIRLAKFDQPIVRARQMNEVDFYSGILACAKKDNVSFLRSMRRCASRAMCEISNEWHLARYEVKDFSPPKLRTAPKSKAASATDSEDSPTAAEARDFYTRAFYSPEFVTRELSVEEAEKEFTVQLKEFGNQRFPFGFLKPEWDQLKAKIRSGDKLWEFRADWRDKKFRGVKLLRRGKCIDAIAAEF